MGATAPVLPGRRRVMDKRKEIRAVMWMSLGSISGEQIDIIRELMIKNIEQDGNFMWAALLVFQYGVICGKREERKRRRTERGQKKGQQAWEQ